MPPDDWQHFGPIAETAGLVDLIAALVSDLKRQDISPARIRRSDRNRRASAKNRELAALYAEYQRLLGGHLLYDVEERFWRARELLRKGWFWVAGPNVKLAVVDGFTDFTHTQHEILELLGAAEQIAGGDADYAALGAGSRTRRIVPQAETDARGIEAAASGLSVQWQERRPESRCAATATLERRLFCNPRQIRRTSRPTASRAGGAKVEIIGASGQLAEIEFVARRIKRLLVLGDEADGNRPVRPHDIAVVFRNGRRVRRRWCRKCSTSLASRWLWSRRRNSTGSPLLQALVGRGAIGGRGLAVSSVAAPCWRTIISSRVGPSGNGGKALAATEWAVRQLQVPRGRKELLSALEWRSKEDAPADPGGDDAPVDDAEIARRKEHRQRYRTACAVLKKLSDELKSIHAARPLSKWTGVLQDLANEFGMLRVAQDA